MIVDDDVDIRGVLAFTLEQAGFDVIEAKDGDEALKTIEQTPPSCVVLDLMMPDVDGFSVLRARRERGLAAGTRFLVLSARTADRDFHRAFELGADDYLTKPFHPDQLVSKIQGLLAAGQAELHQHRTEELEKAELLARVESAFDATPPPPEG